MSFDFKKPENHLSEVQNDQLFQSVLFSPANTHEDVKAIETVAQIIKKEWLSPVQIQALTCKIERLDIESYSFRSLLSGGIKAPWIVIYQLCPYFLEDFCEGFRENKIKIEGVSEISLVHDQICLNGAELSFLDFFRSDVAIQNEIKLEFLTDFMHLMILKMHPFINPYGPMPLEELFIGKLCSKLSLDRDVLQALWLEEKAYDKDHPFYISYVFERASDNYYNKNRSSFIRKMKKKAVVEGDGKIDILSIRKCLRKDADDYAYNVWSDNRMTRFIGLLSPALKKEYSKQDECSKAKKGFFSSIFNLFWKGR